MRGLRAGTLHTGAVIARFCDFLKARQDIPLPVPPGVLIHLDAGDPSETLAVLPPPETEDLRRERQIGFAQNQSFLIVYGGPEGHDSTRRITVRDLGLSEDGVPVLNAWCHERSALRAFRIDHVREVITRDGDVFDPAARFFVETFAMSPDLARCRATRSAPLTRIRPAFTHHMMALAHLGRIDGGFNIDEQDIVAEHCLKMASDAGLGATEGEEETLRRYLMTLKPKKLFLANALRGLEHETPARISALLDAADQVISADGFRRYNEESYFGLLRREMAGMH